MPGLKPNYGIYENNLPACACFLAGVGYCMLMYPLNDRPNISNALKHF